MPSGQKHTDELPLRAVELYAEGFTVAKIAQKLKIPSPTITNWKRKNYPESFEKKRRERLERKAQILEEESLESYQKVTVRQQKLLRAVTNRMARRLAEAPDDQISTELAAKFLDRFIEQEKELFMENDDLLRLKNTKVGGSMAAFGVNATRQGDITVAGYMQNAFDMIHGKQEPENNEPE